MVTSLFRSSSCRDLSSRKTSASSSSRMAFHFVHISRMSDNFSSTELGSRPRSPADIMYNGTLISSATDSAVNVFPTPGGPQSSRMIPLPLPSMTSSNEALTFRCVSVKPRINSFWFAGSTSDSKAFVCHSISLTLLTNMFSHCLDFSEYPRTRGLEISFCSSVSAGRLPSSSSSAKSPSAGMPS